MKRVMMLAMICFFALSGVGLAKRPGGMAKLKMPPGKWWQMPEVAEKLDLTSQEQQELDELFAQSQRRMIDLRNNVQKEKFELELILDQQDFDKPACMNRFKKFQNARTNLADERFKFLVEVRKLLDHNRYRALKTEFQHHRMNQMKKRHGPAGHFEEEGGNQAIPPFVREPN